MRKYYSNFQINTNLPPEKVKSKLNELIDFDYKDKFGENWIKKNFYGDYFNSNGLLI
jgi:hypothetical protein